MKLPKRACKLGSAINSRTEKHGEEHIPAADIPVLGFLLYDKELNALLEDPKAHGTLFRTAPGGFVEPRFKRVDALGVVGKFTDSQVMIWAGFQSEPLALDCTIARVRLEPQGGGTVAMRMLVQCSKVDFEQLAGVYEHMGRAVDVELLLGSSSEDDEDEATPAARKRKAKASQGKLPMNDAEPPADE